MKKYFLFFLYITYYILHTTCFAQDTVAIKYGNNIKAEDMSVYLHRLASDEFEGRETGQKGQKLAAEYIAKYFSSIGIPPYRDTTYFQQYPLILKHIEGCDITSNNKKFELFKDYYYFPGLDDTLINSRDIVFFGYGINEKNYTDFNKSVDIRGKIVIVLNDEPANKKGKSYITKTKERSDWTTRWKKKVNYLKEYEPAAILIVVDSVEVNVKANEHSIKTPTLKLSSADNKLKTIPHIYISRELANKILSTTNKNIDELEKKIRKKGKPNSFEFKSQITIDMKRLEEKISAENVLGYVEGTDLKNQLIVISGHYDHLGKDGDKIYYGADDDGSGTSAVMELAKAFTIAKKEGHGPRRSILFMTVSGEEKGLLGSEYYSENPVFPLDSTVADLNIDMIGRLDEKHKENSNYIYVIGSDKLSTELHKINENANTAYAKLELDYTFNSPDDPNRFYYRSDHYNFAKKNIPVIFYFNGTHADYHKPTDTVDKIDFNKMEKITRLVFFTAWQLANQNERIKVDVKNDFK